MKLIDKLSESYPDQCKGFKKTDVPPPLLWRWTYTAPSTSGPERLKTMTCWSCFTHGTTCGLRDKYLLPVLGPNNDRTPSLPAGPSGVVDNGDSEFNSYPLDDTEEEQPLQNDMDLTHAIDVDLPVSDRAESPSCSRSESALLRQTEANLDGEDRAVDVRPSADAEAPAFQDPSRCRKRSSAPQALPVAKTARLLDPSHDSDSSEWIGGSDKTRFSARQSERHRQLQARPTSSTTSRSTGTLARLTAMLGSGEAKSSPPVRQQVVDPARRASQQTQSPRRPDSLEDRIEQGTGASEITSADSPSNLPPLAKDWTAVRDAIEATAKEFVSSAEDHRRSVESRGGHLMGLVTTLIREVDERRAQAHSACVQVDEMQKEIHDLRQTNRLFSKAMVESRERETRWRAECALASQRVSDAEHRAQVEVNDVKQELEEQASMLKAVQVQQSADWTEHEKIRDERDQLAERNAELEEECAEINAGAEELMAKYNSMQRELASLQASIVRLEAKARVSLFRASLKEN